nr:rhodanese-like domain-containing protein [Caldilineaceae bacterium]
LMNANQPPRPANMHTIVAINQGQRRLALDLPVVPALPPSQIAQQQETGALLLDVRPSVQFADGHLPGAYHVPLDNPNFEQWVGWIIPPDVPLLLVALRDSEVHLALHKLAFLGLADRVSGSLPGGTSACAGRDQLLRKVTPISVQQLHRQISCLHHDQPRLHLLDVREKAEWEETHIAQARHINFKQLGERIAELDPTPQEPIAVVCQSGVRSLIACSILLHHGFAHLYNVSGGMTAWQRAALPVVHILA